MRGFVTIFTRCVILQFTLLTSLSSPSQIMNWANQTGSSSTDLGFSITKDINGNIISCGAFSNSNVDFDPGPGFFTLSSNGDYDIYVTKSNSAGQLLWAFRVGGVLRDEAYNVGTDVSGNIFITGYFRGSNVDFDPGPGTFLLSSNGDSGGDPGWGGDIYVAKYDPSGQFLWAINIGGSQLFDSSNILDVDQNGNVYFGGYFNEAIDFDAGPGTTILDWNTGRIFLAKYNASGQFVWAFNFGSGGNVDNNVYGIKWGPSGNVYVTGFYQGTSIDFDPGPGISLLSSNGSYEFYVAKYTENGQFQWATSAGGTGVDVARSLIIDNSENIYIIGDYWSSSIDFDIASAGGQITNNGASDIFFVKYNNAGQNIFAYGFGGSNTDLGLGLTTDNTYVYIGGGFMGTNIDFDPSIINAPLNSNGGSDIFYSKYLLNGQFQCAFNIGGTSNDYCRSLISTGLNKVSATGYFQSINADFDPESGTYLLSSAGSHDIYHAEYEWNLTVTSINDTTICSGQSVQFTGNGANTYSWSPTTGLSNPNISNPIATPTVTTQYIVTGFIGSGCMARDTVLVTVNPLPSVMTNNDTTICQGTQAQLNGTGAVTYIWSPTTGLSNPNISNPIATPTTTTQYIISGTDINGCVGKDTVVITVGASINVTANNDTTICNGNQVTLNATGASIYSWTPVFGLSDPNISNPIASPIITTQYVVTGSNSNGCTGSDTVLIIVNPLPIVQTNSDTIICQNEQVQLSATGATVYSWSPSSGLSNPNIINPVASPSATTQYVVTGTASNGCSAKDTVVITVNPIPVITISNDTIICRNSSVQLSAAGGIIYSWAPSSTLNNTSISNPIATPTSNTIYYVIVTDINNCSSTDSVSISLLNAAQFSASSALSVCTNGSVQLNASGGDSYSWSPSSTLNDPSIANPIATPLSSTTYSVTISESTCNESATLTIPVIVLPLPDIDITKSNDIDCIYDFAILNAIGAMTYSWSPSGTLNNSAIANPIARPIQTTQYVVKGTDNNGCSNYDSIIVKVEFSNKGIFLIPNAFTPNKDGLNDCFGVRLWGGLEEFEFKIYNRWGALIFHTNDATKCWDGKWKQKEQDPGVFVYWVRAKSICSPDIIFKKGTVVLIR